MKNIKKKIPKKKVVTEDDIQESKVKEITPKERRRRINQWTRKKREQTIKEVKAHKRRIEAERLKDAERVKKNVEALKLWGIRKQMEEERTMEEEKIRRERELIVQFERDKIEEASRKLYKKWLAIKEEADLQKMSKYKKFSPIPNKSPSHSSNEENVEIDNSSKKKQQNKKQQKSRVTAARSTGAISKNLEKVTKEKQKNQLQPKKLKVGSTGALAVKSGSATKIKLPQPKRVSVKSRFVSTIPTSPLSQKEGPTREAKAKRSNPRKRNAPKIPALLD